MEPGNFLDKLSIYHTCKNVSTMEVPQITFDTSKDTICVHLSLEYGKMTQDLLAWASPLHGNNLERIFFFNLDSQRSRYLSLKKRKKQ